MACSFLTDPKLLDVVRKKHRTVAPTQLKITGQVSTEVVVSRRLGYNARAFNTEEPMER
jgi:hypothetical protein